MRSALRLPLHSLDPPATAPRSRILNLSLAKPQVRTFGEDASSASARRPQLPYVCCCCFFQLIHLSEDRIPPLLPSSTLFQPFAPSASPSPSRTHDEKVYFPTAIVTLATPPDQDFEFEPSHPIYLCHLSPRLLPPVSPHQSNILRANCYRRHRHSCNIRFTSIKFAFEDPDLIPTFSHYCSSADLSKSRTWPVISTSAPRHSYSVFTSSNIRIHPPPIQTSPQHARIHPFDSYL